MQRTGVIYIIASLALAFGVGCGGSTLEIRHNDPTHPQAVVYVDREAVGVVEHGKDMSVRVDRGVHLVEIMPPGSQINPWAEDSRGWRLFIDESTVITLFGGAPAPSQPRDSLGASLRSRQAAADAADDDDDD
jgi:hypothetical protein